MKAKFAVRRIHRQYGRWLYDACGQQVVHPDNNVTCNYRFVYMAWLRQITSAVTRIYSGNSETSQIVNNLCVCVCVCVCVCGCVCGSCQGGPADIKVFTDNNRPTEPKGLKYGVAVTAPCYNLPSVKRQHYVCAANCIVGPLWGGGINLCGLLSVQSDRVDVCVLQARNACVLCVMFTH